MSSPVKKNSLIILALILSSCSAHIKGDFAWSSADDRGIEEPELGLLVENEFRYARERIYFYNYETIWWAYMIQEGSYEEDRFIAALYENNLSPEPVEIDLRQVRVTRTGFTRGFIRQKYEPLHTGNYLLRLAYESRIIDEVEFHVIPPGGAHGIQEEDDLPIFDREGEEVDEIIKYSG